MVRRLFQIAVRTAGLSLAVMTLSVARPVSPAAGAQEQPEEKKGSDLVLLPVIAYTPETRLTVGAASIYFFRSPLSNRPSTISAFVMYTQNRQVVSSVGMEVYTRDEKYKIDAGISYVEFPDQFYGVGPDTPESNEEDYTPRSISVAAGLQRRLRTAVHAGIRYEFAESELIEREPDGALDDDIITGSEGGTVSGAGVLLNRDTRDNVYYSTRGSFCEAGAMYYPGWLGSDFEYGRYTLDLRKYFGLAERHVIALQALTVATSGETPFQSLAQLGGSKVMRGYYEGRYRDRYSVVLQSEYRARVWWRIGLVAFGSIGDVAQRPADFRLDHFRYTAGGGIRFLLSRQEGMNLRLDTAFGQDTSGFYITLGEAF